MNIDDQLAQLHKLFTSVQSAQIYASCIIKLTHL